MNEHEGPSVRRIPEQVYNTCIGCKWHKREMIRSGKNPEYLRHCTHPMWKDMIHPIWEGHGREIEREDDRTPGWCPVAGTDKTEQV